MMSFRTVATCTSLLVSSAHVTAWGDVVTDANEVLLKAIAESQTTPPLAARALALFHVATWRLLERAPQEANGTKDERRALALGALRATGALVFPQQAHGIDDWVSKQLPQSLSEQQRSRALEAGERAARRLLESRADDLRHAGAPDDKAPLPAGPEAGYPIWIPQAPAKALHPHWGEARPFALSLADVPVLPPPPVASMPLFARDLEEVASLGHRSSAERSADETLSARFWAQGAGSITPPGQWNRVAQSVASSRNLTLDEEARLFAVLNTALFDASIACWKNKYLYRAPRPDVAVKVALGDDSWEPLLATPPHPEYPSGHSTFSAAAAEVLQSFTGSGNLPIDVASDEIPYAVRSFASFHDAAEEAGRSRIFGGIHFESSNQAGLSLGKAVATKVMQALEQVP